MPEPAGEGQPKTPAPGGGAETQTPGQTGPAPGSGTPPREAGGQNVQQPQKVMIDGKEYSTADIGAIIKAKAGLEESTGELKKKLEKIEAKDLSEKDQAVKKAEKLEKENAELKMKVLNSSIQKELDSKGVLLKADSWAHSITKESEIADAVQKLINENPGIVKADGRSGAGGITNPPGGTAPPPTGTPAGTDAEREIMQKYEKATSIAEIAAIDKELNDLRGTKSPGGRQPI